MSKGIATAAGVAFVAIGIGFIALPLIGTFPRPRGMLVFGGVLAAFGVVLILARAKLVRRVEHREGNSYAVSLRGIRRLAPDSSLVVAGHSITLAEWNEIRLEASRRSMKPKPKWHKPLVTTGAVAVFVLATWLAFQWRWHSFLSGVVGLALLLGWLIAWEIPWRGNVYRTCLQIMNERGKPICTDCGYNLSGLRSTDVCPECGWRREPELPSTQ